MKGTSNAAKAPSSAVEQMLKKKEALISQRDELLARLTECNSSIESLDTVITMFDPKHVPLDIRKVQSNAPVLTLSARPFLTEQASGSGLPDSDVPATAKSKKNGSGPKGARAKPKEKQISVDEAREVVSKYFQDLNRLATIREILTANAEGLPLRRVKELFLDRHPLDMSGQATKKAFGDRLSAILYALGKDGSVIREERTDMSGKKEGYWRLVGNKNSAEDTPSSSDVAQGAA